VETRDFLDQVFLYVPVNAPRRPPAAPAVFGGLDSAADSVQRLCA